MTDYIKREDALEQFDYYDLGEYLTTQIRGMLMDIPSADVVPVVRCKNCKRRMSAAKNGRVYWDGYEYYCGIAHYGVTDDGFCFYGERKDDE